MPEDCSSLRGSADPITMSVLLGRFDSIFSEMSLTLARTAWTPIIAICRDFSCAIYDAVPRQVAMFDAVPIHTTSMHLALDEFAAAFANDIHDGDVSLPNDPYRGNTHIGDFVTASPVFHRRDVAILVGRKGHQLDTGAHVPSSVAAGAQNVWQEGIAMDPCRRAPTRTRPSAGPLSRAERFSTDWGGRRCRCARPRRWSPGQRSTARP